MLAMDLIKQKEQRPAGRSLSYFSQSIGHQAWTTNKPKYLSWRAKITTLAMYFCYHYFVPYLFLYCGAYCSYIVNCHSTFLLFVKSWQTTLNQSHGLKGKQAVLWDLSCLLESARRRRASKRMWQSRVLLASPRCASSPTFLRRLQDAAVFGGLQWVVFSPCKQLAPPFAKFSFWCCGLDYWIKKSQFKVLNSYSWWKYQSLIKKSSISPYDICTAKTTANTAIISFSFYNPNHAYSCRFL